MMSNATLYIPPNLEKTLLAKAKNYLRNVYEDMVIINIEIKRVSLNYYLGSYDIVYTFDFCINNNFKHGGVVATLIGNNTDFHNEYISISLEENK